jgi:hypothetical protein
VRIAARQWIWFAILRVAIGFGTMSWGIALPCLAIVEATRTGQWRTVPVLICGGAALFIAGSYFACYARREWNPRGFVVALARRGLILKVNGIAHPHLIALHWRSIKSAEYIAPQLWGLYPAAVRICLLGYLHADNVPLRGRGVVYRWPSELWLNGWWDEWQPEDVAKLIHAAATDPNVRETL